MSQKKPESEERKKRKRGPDIYLMILLSENGEFQYK